MKSSKKVILISAGDPSSISSEITIKAIKSSKIHKNIMPIIITDPQILNNYEKINIYYLLFKLKNQKFLHVFHVMSTNVIMVGNGCRGGCRVRRDVL